MATRRVKLRLNEVAQARGYNISRLQRSTGLTMGVVRRYWYNETREVSLDNLGILSNLLGVEPGELLIFEENAEPSK